MLYSVEYRQQLQLDDVTVSESHITMLMEGRQRWITLAENARYYQQHLDVTRKYHAS